MGYDEYECGVCYLSGRGNVRVCDCDSDHEDFQVYVCSDCWMDAKVSVRGRLACEGYVTIKCMKCPQPGHKEKLLRDINSDNIFNINIFDDDIERPCLGIAVCNDCISRLGWIRSQISKTTYFDRHIKDF
jgi:hypothetical protein